MGLLAILAEHGDLAADWTQDQALRDPPDRLETKTRGQGPRGARLRLTLRLGGKRSRRFGPRQRLKADRLQHQPPRTTPKQQNDEKPRHGANETVTH